jgi:thiosulfate/3-mercaptopyruvate sulfurtransferase
MVSKLFCLAALSAACFAQANPEMLVTTEWLAAHLNDPAVAILHVGSPKDYDDGHIPGARLVQLSDISITSASGLRLELPPVAALEEAFGKLGAGGAVRVIVYAGTASVQSATRVWFTLDYLGAGERAALLDGGLAVWRAEGRRVTGEVPGPPPPSARRFAGRVATSRVVTAEWVREHLNDPAVLLIDARLPEFYDGSNAGGMPRAGHIPGARNIPFSSLLEENGKLKPVATLQKMLLPGGPELPQEVSYCHLGQQATVIYFVARYLGMSARLYDGSFQDWSRRPDFPVEPTR